MIRSLDPQVHLPFLAWVALTACAEADPAEGARSASATSGPTMPVGMGPGAVPVDSGGTSPVTPPVTPPPGPAAVSPATGEQAMPPAAADVAPPAAVEPAVPVTPEVAMPAPDVATPPATAVPADTAVMMPDPVAEPADVVAEPTMMPEPAAAADELPEDSCEGISRDAECSTPGTCSGLSCGLADTGSRVCTCATTWDCTSCEFPTGADAPSILVPPTDDAPLAECDAATVVEEEACATMGDRCMMGEEVCACWATDSDGATIWDCDDPPW